MRHLFSQWTAQDWRALTHWSVRAGTVSYMCPQMLSGGAVSYYCDVFSFGVVMQEVITGEMAEGRRAMRQPRSVISELSVWGIPLGRAA